MNYMLNTVTQAYERCGIWLSCIVTGYTSGTNSTVTVITYHETDYKKTLRG